MIKEIPKYILEKRGNVLLNKPIEIDHTYIHKALLTDLEYLSGIVPVVIPPFIKGSISSVLRCL